MKTIMYVLLVYLTIMPFCVSCDGDVGDRLAEKIHQYYDTKNRHDFGNPAYTNFKRPVSRTWHGEKRGEGIESTFNPNSGWNQWDVAWDGRYEYEILAIDSDSLIVRIRFKEVNEFLEAVGIPEGLGAVVTFWFDEELKVKETLYEWNDTNQSVHENLQPIVEWALTYDSTAIAAAYLNEGFRPNTETAAIWKPLLKAYNETEGN